MLALVLVTLGLAHAAAAQTEETLSVIITTVPTMSWQTGLPDKTDSAYLDLRADFWRAERTHNNMYVACIIFFSTFGLVVAGLLFPVLVLYERDTRRMERLLRARRAARKAAGIEDEHEETAYPPSYGHVRAAGLWARVLAALASLRGARAQLSTTAPTTTTAATVSASVAAAPTDTYITGPAGLSRVCFGDRTWVSTSHTASTGLHGYFTTPHVPCYPPRTTLYVSGPSQDVIPTYLPAYIADERAQITKYTVAFAIVPTVLLPLLAAWAINIRRRRRKLRLVLGDEVAWFSPHNSRTVQTQPGALPL